jgi:chromosome segregation and condensation protein ScpB
MKRTEVTRQQLSSQLVELLTAEAVFFITRKQKLKILAKVFKLAERVDKKVKSLEKSYKKRKSELEEIRI